jgi:hypothetical protein
MVGNWEVSFWFARDPLRRPICLPIGSRVRRWKEISLRPLHPDRYGNETSHSLGERQKQAHNVREWVLVGNNSQCFFKLCLPHVL